MKRYIAVIIGILTILVVFLLPFGIMIDLAPQGPNSFSNSPVSLFFIQPHSFKAWSKTPISKDQKSISSVKRFLLQSLVVYLPKYNFKVS